MTDPITDMLNQIKNAQAVGKTEVFIPFSELKNKIATLLMNENFISDVKKITRQEVKTIKIDLKYENGLPAIEGIKRVSKPGQRIYVKANDLKKVRGGFGISIVSTPKGLMTNKQAKKEKLGGEVLLEIW